MSFDNNQNSTLKPEKSKNPNHFSIHEQNIEKKHQSFNKSPNNNFQSPDFFSTETVQQFPDLSKRPINTFDSIHNQLITNDFNELISDQREFFNQFDLQSTNDSFLDNDITTKNTKNIANMNHYNRAMINNECPEFEKNDTTSEKKILSNNELKKKMHNSVPTKTINVYKIVESNISIQEISSNQQKIIQEVYKRLIRDYAFMFMMRKVYPQFFPKADVIGSYQSPSNIKCGKCQKYWTVRRFTSHLEKCLKK